MPTDSKRLQVLDRYDTVISAITSGADYFYTPHQVAKILLPFEDAKNGPLYMVLPDSGGSIDLSGHELYDETFFISVKGIVHDRDDLGSKLEKAIRDIRKAINDDSVDFSTGTLGDICVQVRVDEPPEIDYFEDFGFFDQRIRNQISGDFGEL